jgi:PAS domain S-box-containing protein
MIQHWNRQLQDVLNVNSRDLAGRRIVDYIHEDDRLSIRHAIADCMEKGISSTEARFVTSGGETLPMSGQGVRMTLDGRPHICVQISDITDKIRTRLALEDQLKFQSLVAKLSANLLAATPSNLMSVIEQALPQIAGYFDIDRIALWEHDQKAELLVPTMSWNASHVPPFSMDVTSDDFPDTAARIFAGKPIVFSSSETLAKTGSSSRQYFDNANLRSGLMIPIKTGGRVFAMIAMASYDRTINFTDDDVQHGQVITGVIAGALKRHQSEQELNEAFAHIAQLKDSLEAECTVLREEISLSHDHHEIIGQSTALKDVLYRAEQVAATDVTVLINGETGVGKELIAKAIHRASLRHMKPMITVNCAALPPTLIESELFGHERGAFTGADSRRAGRFEVADGGTLFLDEIGELPQGLQAKLLRVLQLGEFERLGSSTTLTSDVRIITATNRDLEKEVTAGRFREDLWYRLNVFPIEVPPLRDRPDDIPALVAFFLERLGHQTGREVKRVPQSVMKSLLGYTWPGNVRELENIIERGVITSTSDEFRLADPLTSRIRSTAPDVRRPLAEVEKEHLSRVLQDRNWKIEGDDGAARILGMNPSTLRARMRKQGIHKPKKQ